MIGQFHSNLPNFALIKIRLQLSNSLIKADWEILGGEPLKLEAGGRGRERIEGDSWTAQCRAEGGGAKEGMGRELFRASI